MIPKSLPSDLIRGWKPTLRIWRRPAPPIFCVGRSISRPRNLG